MWTGSVVFFVVLAFIVRAPSKFLKLAKEILKKLCAKSRPRLRSHGAVRCDPPFPVPPSFKMVSAHSRAPLACWWSDGAAPGDYHVQPATGISGARYLKLAVLLGTQEAHRNQVASQGPADDHSR
jgi:hypothetical protein